MENCIFCKIIAGDIPSPRLYEDDEMIIIRDIEPKAKLHYLCIPKTHFALLSEMDEARAEIVKHCFEKIIDHYGVAYVHANELIESAGKVITITSDGLIIMADTAVTDGDLLTTLYRALA